MPHEVGSCLPYPDGCLLGFLGQELIVKRSHPPVRAYIVLFVTLLELGVLMHKVTHLRSENVH